jgi:hypothetical protein
VGREIARTIRERTAKGIDKNGNAFAPYSEEYIESKEFAIARKSPSQVNLRLTNEMLTDLQVIDVDPARGTITVGITDATSQAKAHGHITGAAGRLPVRDFMGISQSEFATILSKVPEPDTLVRAEAEMRRRAKAEEEAPTDRGFKGAGVTIEDVFGVIDEIANGVDVL